MRQDDYGCARGGARRLAAHRHARFFAAQHGRIVASWGDVTQRLELHSARKSLLNALIGIGVAESRISLDATLASLGHDVEPALSDAENLPFRTDSLRKTEAVAAAYQGPRLLPLQIVRVGFVGPLQMRHVFEAGGCGRPARLTVAAIRASATASRIPSMSLAPFREKSE